MNSRQGTNSVDETQDVLSDAESDASSTPDRLFIDDTFCEEAENAGFVSKSPNITMPEIPGLSILASPNDSSHTAINLDKEVMVCRNDPNPNHSITGPAKISEMSLETSKEVVRDVLNLLEDEENTEPVTFPDLDSENFYTAVDSVDTKDAEKFDKLYYFLNFKVHFSIKYISETGKFLEKEIQKVEVVSNDGNHYSEADTKTSLSSGGSVYSDKTGLPYLLQGKKYLCSSSSTAEEDVSSTTRKSFLDFSEMLPWKNQHLVLEAFNSAIKYQACFRCRKTYENETQTLNKSTQTGPNEEESNFNYSLATKKEECETEILNTELLVLTENTPKPGRKRGRRPSSQKLTKRQRVQPVDSAPGPSGFTRSKKLFPVPMRRNDPGDLGSDILKKENCIAWDEVAGLDRDHTQLLQERIDASLEIPNEKLGPIPDKAIFNGMKFILCYSESTSSVLSQRHRQKRTTSSDFSLSETEDRYLYDRYEKFEFNPHYLRKQITAGGGVVYDHFYQLPDLDMTNVYLVTNRPNITAKFLLSVLNKIHILLHLHIIDACRNGLSKRMRLPHVGWSKVYDKWMEIPRNIDRTLQGKSVYLLYSSDNDENMSDAYNFWILIIQKLGADIVKDLNCEYTDIIVTNQPPPSEMQDSLKAIGSMAPSIVSLQWLIESLYQGCPVSLEWHRSFRFRTDLDSSSS